MKKSIQNICSISICVFAIFISILNLRISKMERAIPSNASNDNIDEFIKENEEMLLSIYDIDISGEKLTDIQKAYITNLYIIQNRGKYVSSITKDTDKCFWIDVAVWKNVYWYLFSETPLGDYSKDVKVDLVNTEKFHINSRNIVKYSCVNDIHILEIEYITKFLDKEYKYNIKYNIGYRDNKYYLIGFVIN